MKTINILLICLMLVTTSCNSAATNTSKNTSITESTDETQLIKPEKNMYELAINQPKEGQDQAFLESRSKFVKALGEQEETLNEGKWKPFFTVVPDLKLDNILVGMTHWNSFGWL